MTKWTLKYGDHALIADGRRVQLTATEADILVPIVQNTGQVVTYATLELAAWGNSETRKVDAYANLRVHLLHLRNKLRPHDIKLHTVWGLGVLLLDPIELDMTLR